jgi:hypothetical protein
VLEDIQHNVLLVQGGLIDNMQFALRRLHLFPNTHGAPSAGDEHQDDTANDTLVRGCSSLVALVAPLLSRSSDR